MRIKKSEAPFADAIIVVLLIVLSLLWVIPIFHVLAKSLSGDSAVISGKVGLVPVAFQLSAYKALFNSGDMMRSLYYTVYVTALGTTINVLVTALGAYPLAQKDLIGRKIIWFLIIFTMFFSGGLIPLFLVVRSLGLLDTVWALILPTTVSTFNLILMKTFFQGLPDSLIESARMDGCPEIVILFRIIMPLSAPIIATLTLFYGMANWNVYFQALIYMTSPEKFPLQLMLQKLLGEEGSRMIASMGVNLPVESMKAASVFFVILPVIAVFPFVQKHFTKGALLGSVKE